MSRHDFNNRTEHAAFYIKHTASARLFSPFCSFFQSCLCAVDRLHDLIVNQELVGPPSYLNIQEFVRDFDGRAVSGQFICSAVARDIFVFRNPNDVYIIFLLHPVYVFSSAVDRPGVHHSGAQYPDSRLATGEYGVLWIFAFQIIVTAAGTANTDACKTL